MAMSCQVLHKITLNCTYVQGCVVGVARSRGNEPGVGVGVDQATSTPTPDRLYLQFDPVLAAQKYFSVKFLGISLSC